MFIISAKTGLLLRVRLLSNAEPGLLYICPFTL